MEFLGVYWCGKLLVGLLYSIVGPRRAEIFLEGIFPPCFVIALSPMPRIVESQQEIGGLDGLFTKVRTDGGEPQEWHHTTGQITIGLLYTLA